LNLLDSNLRSPISIAIVASEKSLLRAPMISHDDISEATEGTDLERELGGQTLGLRQSLNRFAGLGETPMTQDQLRLKVSQVLTADPSVAAVFYLELEASEPEFRLFGSNVDEIPNNVKQWAANIAISCCTTEQTRLEQSEDAPARKCR